MDYQDSILGSEVAVAVGPLQARRWAPEDRQETSTDAPVVCVVDPDPATGARVNEALDGSSLRCEAYCSGREFFAAYDPSRPTCLVLEMRIPDMGGLQLQRRLAASGSPLPLVFVTSHADVSMAVEAMRGGAVHVLEKPVRPMELWSAIQEALAREESRCREQEHQRQMRERVAALTRKERQVVQLIAEGKSVKAMATRLGLSVRAVELRRRSLMEKLDLHTPLELMRFSILAVSREFCEPLAVA
jgi:FixJ family two-component response regulator